MDNINLAMKLACIIRILMLCVLFLIVIIGYCKLCKFWDDNLGDNCKKFGVIFCNIEEVRQFQRT